MDGSTGSTRSSPQKIRLFSGPGTRRWPRFDISDVPSITGISSNTGSRIKVVNISQGGALLQTAERAALRAKIQLNFAISQGVIQLAGFVLRSSASYPKGIPQYQAAVVFDRPLLIFDETQEQATEASPALLPGSVPSVRNILDAGEPSTMPIQDEGSAIISAFLAIHFCQDKDSAQDEMFKLNDW